MQMVHQRVHFATRLKAELPQGILRIIPALGSIVTRRQICVRVYLVFSILNVKKNIETQDSRTIDDHVDLHYEHQFNYFNFISVKSPVGCQFGIADDSKQYSVP